MLRATPRSIEEAEELAEPVREKEVPAEAARSKAAGAATGMAAMLELEGVARARVRVEMAGIERACAFIAPPSDDATTDEFRRIWL